MGNLTFKVLLLLPLYLLSMEALIHIYAQSFDFSFVVILLMLLLWSVEVWWIFKNGSEAMPLSVLLVSAFVAFYLSYVVDKPLKLSVYGKNALWAFLYAYAIRDGYLRSLKEAGENASMAGQG
ncbi:hypothetical protein [Thermococcus nautili]|uniref:Uncharacterized protein n=1 Tax=Thermococcus nautili TaxID=195522 RepID=W8NVY8_9EURY|nr:hypothetical protein [Thermococcus nautili]AHL23453.1 hypothetical protein BD01_1851 [Thermococcus nautili]